MDTATIIGHLDAEISKLQQAKALLAGTDGRKGPGRPKASGAISNEAARSWLFTGGSSLETVF
jgi:hypothetical protein